ncbi:hypothetical protein QMK19_36235 [Streptomyces sp. H10-C2]|nr:MULTISPECIES: hypothetical protein [unclassified Streptomyces]MDJ0346313.1 hypothetical protein [Streptomyces sp. PH10-H1]MDJ0374922.1 hypothetical protein [Streptomyces sp. H10-C2]
MIDSKNTERSLFSAIIPPGPTHVHAVHSLALEDNLTTTLNAGFWSSLPLDYFLRITGRSHLQFAEVQKMPAAFASHPLAEPLLLRTLRLACITGEFAPLWSELFRREWADREKWAAIWPLLEGTLSAGISGEWTQRTPLRTEYERRAALVELDALVAAWLGITADQLTAIYRSRYSILADREAEMWFDAKGRRLAQDPYAFGYGQAKEDYAHIQSHLANPHRAPIPEGYTAPFYKADREKEMRAAHAVFVKQLNDAVARGEWDPVKQEVPKP